jgi:hypothetical protein
MQGGESYEKMSWSELSVVLEQARGRDCTVCVGRAHEGMAIAAENILDLVREQLHQAARYSSTHLILNYEQQIGNSCVMFSELPDYRVVLLGYSLGAGVVPLIALTLLQVLLVPHL